MSWAIKHIKHNIVISKRFYRKKVIIALKTLQ